MKFQREVATDSLISELIPVLVLHYQEIAKYKDIPLAPDFNKYLEAERGGYLRVYTARAEDGTVQGYGIFFVNRNGHYSTSLQAIQDVFYINKNHRGVRVGMNLIRFCESELKSEGVQIVYQHVKKDHPALGRLLEHEGYEVIDLIYGKRID